MRKKIYLDRKSTRLNSSHSQISYAVFCLKKKKTPGAHNITGAPPHPARCVQSQAPRGDPPGALGCAIQHALCVRLLVVLLFFFFNDTATTEIYTLSLHDALPILACLLTAMFRACRTRLSSNGFFRSEEHTSELQSQSNLVCRLLLEKNKTERLPVPEHCRTATYSPPADACGDN